MEKLVVLMLMILMSYILFLSKNYRSNMRGMVLSLSCLGLMAEIFYTGNSTAIKTLTFVCVLVAIPIIYKGYSISLKNREELR